VIYAGGWLRGKGGATQNMKTSPLWLAANGTGPQTIPTWADWTMWQYTDGTTGPYAGTIPGIGACDQSIFKGTQADLDALWQKYT
jgi:lysozyme